ncbi:MAG: hypothetical protein ACKPKO_59355, partial [Candidatus Fonsibacter sp.]
KIMQWQSVSSKTFSKGLAPHFYVPDYRLVSGTLRVSTIVLMENIIARRKSDPSGDRAVSPWELTHGEPFYRKLIPFGAQVYFKPSDNGI